LKKEGLSKKERLTKNSEFQKVFKYGKKVWVDSILLILYTPNELGIRRLGIVVSKKIKKATKRNKVKRWIREIFRKNKESFPEGCDFIIIPHPKMGELSFAEIKTKVLEKLAELKS
jgi:ribonuclease P protein component